MISIVIPVFNQVHLTKRCLDSVLEHSAKSREITVVDNASQDATASVLLDFKKEFENRGWKFQIISNLENRGFGRACNQGIKVSHAEYIAILNNDTWLMPHWDQNLLEHAQELQADMIGPYYDESSFDPVITLKKSSLFTERNRNRYSKEWVSILMLFKRGSLDRLGLFDERFFVTYEDTDLRERMDRAKMRYFKSGRCFIWHMSKGTRETQSLPQGYEQEGLRLFIEKWGFDPRLRDASWKARWSRKWTRLMNHFGRF